MSNWKCIAVEDEPLAQRVLQQYIEQHPSLELIAMCDDAFQAQQHLAHSAVDILFLDINLPRISGINFLKTLRHPPAVIFTTAYPEFAVEGFELDAVDYLLKPFSFERFLKAVNKAVSHSPNKAVAQQDSIYVKSDKKVFRVVINDIIDLEALGDYVRIRMVGAQHLVNSTLRDLLDELPKEQFMRIHKSFAIALNKIEFIEGNYVRIGGKDVPIGATYRDEVMAMLKR
jgi:DNA-binding LytR/AlgR family response regulator